MHHILIAGMHLPDTTVSATLGRHIKDGLKFLYMHVLPQHARPVVHVQNGGALKYHPSPVCHVYGL
jgi:hypothetical protein